MILFTLTLQLLTTSKSQIIFDFLCEDNNIQVTTFALGKSDTYFSGVISHAYYAIFYAAKAYLLSKGIETRPPEEHKKTFKEFEKLTEEGIIDVELLKLYKKLPQANRDPAEQSIANAQTFVKHIYSLCAIETAKAEK
jgi:uncharacterized protein (UPF0332 family)